MTNINKYTINCQVTSVQKEPVCWTKTKQLESVDARLEYAKFNFI